MSTTKRSWEFSAVPLTVGLLGVLALVFWAFSAGLWVWVGVGVVLFGGLTAAALVYMARPHHPHAPSVPSLPDGAARHVADGVHRVLVVADDSCTPADLGAALARRREHSSTEAFVIAPALSSRTARWTSDDRAYAVAGEHLEATVAALRALDIPASGHVGSHDPLQAIEDGLREFPADEIVFTMRTGGDSNWLEVGAADAVRARYPIPARMISVPSATH